MAGGQCDAQQFLPDLLDRVLADQFDMTSLISHRMTLEEAPHVPIMCRTIPAAMANRPNTL